jgi:hypothetical protein
MDLHVGDELRMRAMNYGDELHTRLMFLARLLYNMC